MRQEREEYTTGPTVGQTAVLVECLLVRLCTSPNHLNEVWTRDDLQQNSVELRFVVGPDPSVDEVFRAVDELVGFRAEMKEARSGCAKCVTRIDASPHSIKVVRLQDETAQAPTQGANGFRSTKSADRDSMRSSLGPGERKTITLIAGAFGERFMIVPLCDEFVDRPEMRQGSG